MVHWLCRIWVTVEGNTITFTFDVNPKNYFFVFDLSSLGVPRSTTKPKTKHFRMLLKVFLAPTGALEVGMSDVCLSVCLSF